MSEHEIPTYSREQAIRDMMTGVENLDTVVTALVREKAIREMVAVTGESREVVEESLGALDAMNEEAVLDLTEGEPTTLRDGLERYVQHLDSDPFEHDMVNVDGVVNHLSALLAYPWSGEEEILASHAAGTSVKLDVTYPDDDHVEVRLGDTVVFSSNYDEIGRSGMDAVERAVREVHRRILFRVIGDRDHIVQVDQSDRMKFWEFLKRPSGSLPLGNRLTVEAVQGGGILVRTRPYSYQGEFKARNALRHVESLEGAPRPN